jgi:hypothetical protein
MDHLKGKVFVEYLSPLKRNRIKTKLLKERGMERAAQLRARPPLLSPAPSYATDQESRMKVIFAGTPEFAAVALQALHEAGFEIPLVLTQPDRPAGRGDLQPSAVKQYAVARHGSAAAAVAAHGQQDPVRAEQASPHQRLLSTPYDVMVVAAYGLILPRSTLDIKPCLNIHGSLLPRWRGAAPIHRAIEAGDKKPASPSCRWKKAWTRAPCCWSKACPSRRRTAPARCTTSWPPWAAR